MSAPTSKPIASADEQDGAGGFDPAFLGVPAPLPDVGAHRVVELAYTHFTIQLDTERALAVCAAVNIGGATLIDLPRADTWKYDPRVPEDQ